MVTKIERWKAEDGKEFLTELEAYQYENEKFRVELEQLKWAQRCQPQPMPIGQRQIPKFDIFGLQPQTELFPSGYSATQSGHYLSHGGTVVTGLMPRIKEIASQFEQPSGLYGWDYDAYRD